jgi:hypothetical protein
MALYNLADPIDIKKYDARTKKLKDEKALVDLTNKSKRSLPQNALLHVWLMHIANESGNSIEKIKVDVYKKDLNKDLYPPIIVEGKYGNEEKFRSSTTLTKDEMSLSMKRLNDWHYKMEGYDLPKKDSKAEIQSIRAKYANYINQFK